MKTKILEIDYDYYYYPDGITCVEEFIEYCNDHFQSFIELTRLETENCVFPYFIREDVKRVFLNISTMEKVAETEVTVMCRLNYDTLLSIAVNNKCKDCVNYEEDTEGDNMKGHRDKLTLDGECWAYHKKQ